MEQVKTNQMTVAALVIWPVSSSAVNNSVMQMGMTVRSCWSDSMFQLYIC
jgi:hypothetical protein